MKISKGISKDMILKNKVCVITGAAKGIGKGILLELARNGAIVAGCDIDHANLKSTINEINQSGGVGFGFKIDVSRQNQVTRMVKTVIDKFGRVDILVNNAGIAPYKHFFEMTEKLWNRVIDTNLKSVFLCSLAVSKYMKKEKTGCIINISSPGADRAQKYLCAYDAAKGGINSLTRQLAVELGEYGIRVNAVSPGTILVERNKPILEKYRKSYNKMIPLGRLGRVSDVSTFVVFLCSESANYLTGQIITLDGGASSQIIEIDFGVPKGEKKYTIKS